MSILTRAFISALVFLGGSFTSFLPSSVQDKKQNRKEDLKEREARKRKETLEDLSQKLSRRLAMRQPSEENAFLHSRASELLERAKQAQEDGYLFDRLSTAADVLLEASQRVFQSLGPTRAYEQNQPEAAIALQAYYFRVQQAEYFAGLSAEKNANTYVRHSRSLYQQARSAYDSKDYGKAKKLGEAASYIVKALENLALASVRVPEPPRLK